jgi:cytochrome c5
LIISACLISNALASGADANSKKDDPPSKESAAPAPPKKAEKKPQKKLSGAELYALHCNRCHPERYATERTADQWKTILLHMRTRANLPAEQAKTILQYLQEDSGK